MGPYKLRIQVHTASYIGMISTSSYGAEKEMRE